jgi:hypothetical protein
MPSLYTLVTMKILKIVFAKIDSYLRRLIFEEIDSMDRFYRQYS